MQSNILNICNKNFEKDNCKSYLCLNIFPMYPFFHYLLINSLFIQPLNYLINLSFSNGVFPNLLKTSNVTPVFNKTRENQDYNNY